MSTSSNLGRDLFGDLLGRIQERVAPQTNVRPANLMPPPPAIRSATPESAMGGMNPLIMYGAIALVVILLIRR